MIEMETLIFVLKQVFLKVVTEEKGGGLYNLNER